jgi:hypothetical protein
MLESPKVLAGDGALLAWVGYVLTHGAAAIITALTIAILVLRVMILLRQWRAGS